MPTIISFTPITFQFNDVRDRSSTVTQTWTSPNGTDGIELLLTGFDVRYSDSICKWYGDLGVTLNPSGTSAATCTVALTDQGSDNPAWSATVNATVISYEK